MTGLYRFRDRDGVLLYVGISATPFKRIMQHERKPWITDAATVDIEWYSTHEEAADAEICAIRQEYPVHNIQGIGGRWSTRETPTKPYPLGPTERLFRHA